MDNALAPTGVSLWSLRGQLFDLMMEREEIGRRLTSVGPDLDAALAEMTALDTAIRTFVVGKVKDVDEVRGPILAMRDAAGVCRTEASRAENQALAWDRRADQLEAIVKQGMEALEQSGFWKPKQTRKLLSPLGSLTLRGNGGVQPVAITDESLLSDDLCNVEVKMTAEHWATVADQFPAATVRRVPSKSRIQDALGKSCPSCNGQDNPVDCPSCGGSGLAGVAGAHLEPRGKSVVIR